MVAEHQIVVIGAGPAGLSAAVSAGEQGAQVLVIDASPRPGGQYWRHADPQHNTDPGRWHHGWSTYQRLVDKLQKQKRAGRVKQLHGHQVLALHAGDTFTLTVQPVPELQPARSVAGLQVITSDRVVLAPGTYDRQLPVPGWTLPGVMAAGGIQAFIKTQGSAPGRRAVIAGTGPFLLAAAGSLLHAGAEVAAVVESSSLRGWLPGLAERSAGAAAGMLVPSKAAEGVEYAALLAKHRVPYMRRAAVTEVHGSRQAEAVTVSRMKNGHPVPDSQHRIDNIDLVGLSWGFVPQAELLLQTGVETGVDSDGSLVGVVRRDQRSSVPNLWLAGEITGVAGATAAVLEGRIAGRAAAQEADRGPIRRRRAPHLLDKIQLAQHHRFAAAMHRAHQLPAGWTEWLEEQTLICRCEEVPYREARAAADQLTADEPRGLKGVTRIGMGWCQGRMCGTAAQCFAAQRRPAQEPPTGTAAEAAARNTATRPLTAPVRLGDLAASEPIGHAKIHMPEGS